jgi:hypothetical protein
LHLFNLVEICFCLYSLIKLDTTGDEPTASIELGDFKTVDNFKVYKSTLPANLAKEIASYVDREDVKEGTRLFKKNNGGDYVRGSFSPIVNTIMTKAVGKTITDNALRKAFDSWFLSQKRKISRLLCCED